MIEDVRSRAYPAKEHTYPISPEELQEFEEILKQRSAEFGDK